jgi:hypothetical protein
MQGGPSIAAPAGRRATGGLWIGLAILAMLTPLGLLAAGTAWGEWGVDELQGLHGSVPAGLGQLHSLWSAPLPDYSLPFLQNATVGYIVSAALGMAFLIGLILTAGKLLLRKDDGL